MREGGKEGLHEKVGGVSLASSVFRSIPRSTPLSVFILPGSKGFHPSFGLRCHPGAGRPLAGVDPFILSYKDRVIPFSFENFFFCIFFLLVRVWCAKQCGLCRLQESRPDGRSFIHPSTLPTPLFPRTRCPSLQFFQVVNPLENRPSLLLLYKKLCFIYIFIHL